MSVYYIQLRYAGMGLRDLEFRSGWWRGGLGEKLKEWRGGGGDEPATI